MSEIKLDVWGRVTWSKATIGFSKVKLVRSPGGGYLFITLEHGVEYDVWVETIEEIVDDISLLDIDWEIE